jgi:hypothetical protein
MWSLCSEKRNRAGGFHTTHHSKPRAEGSLEEGGHLIGLMSCGLPVGMPEGVYGPYAY